MAAFVISIMAVIIGVSLFFATGDLCDAFKPIPPLPGLCAQ